MPAMAARVSVRDFPAPRCGWEETADGGGAASVTALASGITQVHAWLVAVLGAFEVVVDFPFLYIVAPAAAAPSPISPPPPPPKAAEAGDGGPDGGGSAGPRGAAPDDYGAAAVMLQSVTGGGSRGRRRGRGHDHGTDERRGRGSYDRGGGRAKRGSGDRARNAAPPPRSLGRGGGVWPRVARAQQRGGGAPGGRRR